MKKYLIFIFMVLIQGCNITSNDSGNNSTGGAGACKAYDTPSINIEVKDSIRELPINSSYVTIHIQNHNSIFEAEFEREEGADTYSYFSAIDIRSQEFKFNILVTDPSYHSFTTKNIEFNVDTGCSARNNLRYEVYLCPMGSSCL